MILDIPRFKCFIDCNYLTGGDLDGIEEAYCFAVTLIENRPILWTIHTINGAVYSRIPTWAIYLCDDKLIENLPKDLDPWGAISSDGQIIKHQYLKDYEVHFQNKTGRYLFTIDYFDGGFSEDPEQHKTTNVIHGVDDRLYCLPNNQCVFNDRHFTTSIKNVKHYRRNEIYYTLD